MNFLLTVGPSEYKDKIIETKGFLETLGFGGQMLLQGMLTVFAVLVIIWGALVLFKLIFHDLPEKRKAKTENTNVLPVDEAQPDAGTDDEEVIAAITAAIAMAESENSGMKFRVVSFKHQ